MGNEVFGDDIDQRDLDRLDDDGAPPAEDLETEEAREYKQLYESGQLFLEEHA